MKRDLEPPHRSRPKPVHVLLVEDDEDQSERLAATLNDAGCRVDVALDGAEAVRQTAALGPDVVLMDLGLPTIDGWEAIRLIRRAHGRQSPYVIAVSGFSDARSRQLAYDAGCNEYIVKPFDVVAALRAFVARRPHLSLAPRAPTGHENV